MPKVSVIITAYNQASYIGEALLSVINQSYSDWECIIVDDGSTDDTLKFCERLADNDSRFRIVTQMNSGVAAARNKGFSLSKGEFIQFLDGDDFIMPSKLEVQLKHMIANPQYGVSYTNHRHFWQTTGSLAQYTFEILEEQPLQQILFAYDRGVSIPIHSAMFRRSIWSQNEMPFSTEYKHRYEDWVFWVQIVLKGVRFTFIDQPLAVYRMHSHNFVKGAEQMAINALYATNYISTLIPMELRDEFQKQTFDFVLKRYADSKIKNLTTAYHFKQIMTLPGFLLKKIKRYLGKTLKNFWKK